MPQSARNKVTPKKDHEDLFNCKPSEPAIAGDFGFDDFKVAEP